MFFLDAVVPEIQTLHQAIKQATVGREKLDLMKQIVALRNQAKPLLAPNGKPSKLNSVQHALVRTPEFKAWFGDFEQANQPPVKILELTGNEIQGLTPNEARKNAKQFIDDLIANLIAETGADTLHNKRTNFDIRLTKKGVVHGFQHQGEPTIKAIAEIKGLIENSAKIATMPHEPANENFKYVHTFVAPLKIAGKLYAVKLTAKEEWNGKIKLYDHQALEMPDGIYESISDKSDSIHRPASGELSIAQLLTAFNGENSKYVASKSVDENGEPTVQAIDNFVIFSTKKQKKPHSEKEVIDHYLSKLAEKYGLKKGDKREYENIDPSRYGSGWTASRNARNANYKNGKEVDTYNAVLLYIQRKGKLTLDDYSDIAEIRNSFLTPMERVNLGLMHPISNHDHKGDDYFCLSESEKYEINNFIWKKIRKQKIIKSFEKDLHDAHFNKSFVLDSVDDIFFDFVIVPISYHGEFREIRDAALADYHSLRKKNPDGFIVSALKGKTKHSENYNVHLEHNEKFSSKTGDKRKFQIIPKLPELLENATWYGFDKPRKESQLRNVDGYHYVISKADIDGIGFDVAFVVREDNNGNFYHNHTLYREKGAQEIWVELEESSNQRSNPSDIAPQDLSLYRPRPKINTDISPESVDENGEPTVQAIDNFVIFSTKKQKKPHSEQEVIDHYLSKLAAHCH